MPFRITVDIPDLALAEQFSTTAQVTVERLDTPETGTQPPTPVVSPEGHVVTAETGEPFPGSPLPEAAAVAPVEAAPEEAGAEVASDPTDEFEAAQPGF